MYWQFYLRNGLVFIPTTGFVQRAFYRIVEPVSVVPVSDSDAVHRALSATMARGNPKVTAPQPSDRSPPFLTKYAGVKSWSTFVRSASLWGIDEREGTFGIYAYRRDPPNGWVRDERNDVTFPVGTTASRVIERMISILQEAARAGTQ